MSQNPSNRTIRLYCDGELDAAEADALTRRLEDDATLRGRVEFEKRLRRAVADSIAGTCKSAPAGLGDRIRERLDREPPVDPVTEPDPEPARSSLGSWLRGPQKMNAFAVAASLALVGAAVLYGIFGPSIDRIGSRQGIDLVASATEFTAQEHLRCAGDAAARSRKATFRKPGELAENLSLHIGEQVGCRALVDGLGQIGWDFVGGGRCGVPVGANSGHMIFRRDDAPIGHAMLSLFLLADNGRYEVVTPGRRTPVASGAWIRLEPPEVTRSISIYSDGRLVYIMTACYAGALDGAADAIVDALAGDP